MYPAGALTPLFGIGTETAGGNVDVGAEGCDVTGPGGICDNKRSGSKEIASTIGNHRQCALDWRRFKPSLKSNCSPNADLIIIKTENSDRAVVPAVEVIDAGTEVSGD